jgi:ParE toxin of type II toxin-antitoxin system, parDE
MRPVEFLGVARAELRVEAAYYRGINRELARRFLIAVEETIKAIATSPLAMQILEFEIRRWPVEGFPHGVLYRVEAHVILVLSIFHPKQDPNRWHERARI